MLFFRTLTLFLVVTSASGQTGCSVCGDGKAVTAPSAVFSFPSQPPIPCGMLQDAGMNGYIPLEQCVFLPPLLTMCGCAPSEYVFRVRSDYFVYMNPSFDSQKVLFFFIVGALLLWRL